MFALLWTGEPSLWTQLDTGWMIQPTKPRSSDESTDQLVSLSSVMTSSSSSGSTTSSYVSSISYIWPAVVFLICDGERAAVFLMLQMLHKITGELQLFTAAEGRSEQKPLTSAEVQAGFHASLLNRPVVISQPTRCFGLDPITG